MSDDADFKLAQTWYTAYRSVVKNLADAFAEIARLETALLASDGWRCDSCNRVFSAHDPDRGHDCNLCDACATEAVKAGDAL